jgi:hypothetical protein
MRRISHPGRPVTPPRTTFPIPLPCLPVGVVQREVPGLLTKARKPSARHGTGKRWQVWYQVDGHETFGGSFANREVAKKKLIELESSVQRGVWVDPTDQTRVIEYARQHFATRPHSDRTARRIESMIRNHLDGTALGGRRLASVRPSEVQAWATDRSKMLAPSTTAAAQSVPSSPGQ